MAAAFVFDLSPRQNSGSAYVMFHIFHRLAMTAIRRIARDKMKWFVRYNRWVLRWGALRVARTNFGSLIKGDINDHIMKRIFYFGVWEPNNSRAIERLLRTGDVFVDVGANIGYDSLLASQLVGSSGTVVAIEPSPPIFHQLETNIALNSASNIRPVQLAASSREGELILYGGDAGNQGRTSSLQRVGLVEQGKVKMLPLDAILSDVERKNARLIKIDIEGGECEVLKRLADTLQLYPSEFHILVELSPEDGGDELSAVFDRLIAHGFSAFVLENSYDLNWYLYWCGYKEPIRVDRLPKEQCDVLFSRLPHWSETGPSTRPSVGF
jgi:FkbM family methyltransferase